ncbi:uncharacterized protein PG998_006014 [Apiospora kogelbergensis]|uniref:uncharacterized protein n=1 Tax=Apiospora kogelbergensis TaxID=1337665 RepID=UPI00313274FE
MQSRTLLSLLWSFLLLVFVAAQTASTTDATTTAAATSPPPAPTSTAAGGSTQAPPSGSSTAASATTQTGGGGSQPSGSPGSGSGSGGDGELGPPDVLLQVPELHVGRIELIVDNLQAEINLGAQVASLVEINAGVQVGIKKVNITIADVDANLDLVIRLGNLVDIVNRTLASLDLNPLLINVLDTATDLVGEVVGAVDGLLGSIVNGDSKINFLIDNLGNIVQEVAGDAGKIVSSIIGNFDQNMTYTGAQKFLDGGLTQKTYKYDPLSALVNIVTNAAGQVVRAVVVGKDGNGGTTSSTVASSSLPTSTPAARRR